MKKLTEEDFILKEYSWTKESIYGLTEDNILLRYDKDKTGFPLYQCLYQGFWEVTDIGISYEEISKARPITEEEALVIIKREEKPLNTRPKERDYWVS